MGGKEVEFVPLLVSTLKQEGIAGRGNRKSSASLDRQFKHSVLFEIRPHQPEFIVIIKPQVFFLIQADGVAVIDGILFILPEGDALRRPGDQPAFANRRNIAVCAAGVRPAVIAEHALVEVAGDDGAVRLDCAVLNPISQAEAGQHSPISADGPGVLLGAVFPVGAPGPKQQKSSHQWPAGNEVEI